MKSLTFPSVAVVIVALSSGCSSNMDQRETVVTGKVTLNGEVLTMGEVVFESADGKASGQGEIGANGTYRVPSAPLGKIRAAVRTSNYVHLAGNAKKVGGKTITMDAREGNYVPVPKRYEDTKTSGLEYDITPDATIDIPLSK
jgi:hypothetical protein